jgi:hypothetical protein
MEKTLTKNRLFEKFKTKILLGCKVPEIENLRFKKQDIKLYTYGKAIGYHKIREMS